MTVTQTRGNSITTATICSQHIRSERVCRHTKATNVYAVVVVSPPALFLHLILTRSEMAHAAGKKKKKSRSRHRNRRLETQACAHSRRCRAPTISLREPKSWEYFGCVTASGGRSFPGGPTADELAAKPLHQPDDIVSMHHSLKRDQAFIKLKATMDALMCH